MGNKLSYTVKPFDGTRPEEKGPFIRPLMDELEFLYGCFCESEEEWIDHQWKMKHILDLLAAYNIQVVDEEGDPLDMEYDEDEDKIDLSNLSNLDLSAWRPDKA